MKVLAALDDSARAPHVLEAALKAAEHLGAIVVPFRAVQVPPEFPPAAATHHKDELPDYLMAESRRALERLTHDAPAELLGDPVVCIGEAWRAIVESADAASVVLIVLGSHGYHGLDRVLGTTCRHVADEAREDVMVVHDQAGVAIGSVLIALSGGPHDIAVFEKGLDFAHRWGATAHVLRVVQIGNALPPPRQPIVGYAEVSELESTERAIRLAPGDPSIVSRRVGLSVARPWRAIVEAARELKVDLVVVGSHGHRTRDAVARTTPGHMVDEATENVLVVHGETAAP